MSEPLSSNGNASNSIEDIVSRFGDDAQKANEEVKEPKIKTTKIEDDNINDNDEEINEADIELEDKSDDDKLNLESDEDDEGKKSSKPSEEDDIEIDAPPRKKEILAKYPKLFKEFPWLEKAQFRDKQFTELFGSFDDAKEIAERSKILDHFETDLLNGNTETILKQIKHIDQKAFDKVVDNYLPALYNTDKEAYFEIVGNISKHLIADLVKESRSIGDNNSDASESLKNAALVINQFLFGSSNYEPPKQRVAKADDRDEEIKQERNNFTRERYEIVKGDLQIRVDNTLKSTIDSYIDKNDEMSGYVKKNAIRDALTMLHSEISKDINFRKSLDKLWESAFNEKLSLNSQNRIRSMYLGKAKQLLPSVIKKARIEALKDLAPKAKKAKSENEEEIIPYKRSGTIESGRPRQKVGGETNKRKDGESVLDFLSRD